MPFEEIKDNLEKYYNYQIIHYTDGYKKIRLKYLQNTDKIEKIWLNSFVRDDLEIIIDHGLLTKVYYIKSSLIDPLKFNARNIIQKDIIESDIDKDTLIDDLKKEINSVKPDFLRHKITNTIKF